MKEKVKGLNIPNKLIELINRKDEIFHLENFSLAFPFLTFPINFLESIEEIKGISEDNYLLNEDFWGIKSSQSKGKYIDLPWLDYDKSLFIAINKFPGEDLAIALDYRLNENQPRVVASDFNEKYPHCEWHVIAKSFDDLLEKLHFSPSP